MEDQASKLLHLIILQMVEVVELLLVPEELEDQVAVVKHVFLKVAMVELMVEVAQMELEMNMVLEEVVKDVQQENSVNLQEHYIQVVAAAEAELDLLVEPEEQAAEETEAL